MILAVFASNLEPKLRHLAQTLAVFANDDGGEMWPGVRALMRATGQKESTVRHGLQALIGTGVLERDGNHGHNRRYRFNLVALANYRARQDTSARAESARRREQARRRSNQQPCTAVQGSDPQTCTAVQGSNAVTLHNGALPHGARPLTPTCRIPGRRSGTC